MLSLSVSKKGYLLVSIPLLTGLIFVFSLIAILRTSDQQLERLQRSRLALSQVRDNELVVAQLLLSIVGTLNSSVADSNTVLDFNLDAIREARAELQGKALKFAYLQDLLKSSSKLLEDSQDLAVKAKNVFSNKSISKRQRIAFLREDIFDLFIKMGKLGKSTLTSEQTIQRMEPSAMQQSQVRIRQALVVGLSCSFLVSVSLALLFSNDIIRRLRLINENAAKLGRNECLNPLLKPGDEIADLDQAIHESQNLLGQARMRERAILDNSLDLLCSLSPDLQIVAVGTAAEKLLGLQLKDIQGQDVTKFLAGNSQNFKASCKTLIQSDEDSAIEVEAAISANTGARASNGIGTNPGAGSDTDANTSTATSTNAETISMLWTIRWSVNARILYCVARDISREKELEAMKQRLLAIVSHDIRTPLSSVINALSNLRTRSEIAESEASLKLDHCQNQLKKLLNSLEEFLDMQRIERGKLQMNMTCVSAVDLLVCAIDMLSILASEKKIDIQLPVGDAAIAGDEKRLIQTVAFFLKQAIASSGPGSAVRTSIELLDQPGADKKFVDLAISFFPRDSAAARMFMDSPAERLSSEALNREATVSDESAQSLQFTIVEYVLRAHNGSFKIKKNKQQNQETICLRLPLYDSGEGEDE